MEVELKKEPRLPKVIIHSFAHTLIHNFVRGAGGIRTLVQTSSNIAFYALIRLLVFVRGPEAGTQTTPYPLFLIVATGRCHDQPDVCERPVIRPESGLSTGGTSRPGTWYRDQV